MCDQRLRDIRRPDGCKNLQTHPWRWRKCLYVNAGLCQRKTGVPTSISPKTVKPHSSHIQALTSIHRPQTATSCTTLRRAHSALASLLSVFTAGLWIYPRVFLKAFQPTSSSRPVWTLPCLLWFRRPAVLAAPAAPPSLALPANTDREGVRFFLSQSVW